MPPPTPPPTPAEPTPTPTHQYPFIANPVSFNTGTPQMTRITGMVWKIIDLNTSQFDAEPGYQMRLTDPSGQEHLSDVSGLGGHGQYLS